MKKARFPPPFLLFQPRKTQRSKHRTKGKNNPMQYCLCIYTTKEKSANDKSSRNDGRMNNKFLIHFRRSNHLTRRVIAISLFGCGGKRPSFGGVSIYSWIGFFISIFLFVCFRNVTINDSVTYVNGKIIEVCYILVFF